MSKPGDIISDINAILDEIRQHTIPMKNEQPTKITDLSITGLTGGKNLDSVPTGCLPTCSVIEIVCGSPQKTTQWKLLVSALPIVPGVVQPLDDATRQWIQVL